MAFESVLSEDVIARTIRGQVVILSRSSSEVVTLNETASVVLEALPGASSLRDLARAVMARFAVDDEARVRADVKALLVGLRDQGVLREEATARVLADAESDATG